MDVRSLVVGSAICVLLLPAQGLAQIAVEPAAPKAQETVRLRAFGALGGDYLPDTVEVTMAANRISASIRYSSVIGVPLPLPPIDIVLGQFPAGSYEVEFTRRNEAGAPIGQPSTQSFTVISPAKGTSFPLVNYTDLWWDSTESGWGLGITQHVSDALFATWFVYGADGKPIWYVLPGGTWVNFWQYSGAVYKTTGPYYGGQFNPAAVTVTQAGTATLTFNEYDRATFTYTIDGVTGTKTIRRQPF